MVKTASTMLELGKIAPDFSLYEPLTGNTLSLKDIPHKKGLVVTFICNHCPYVVHINQQLVQVAAQYIEKGVGFVAISSNDAENYPQDGPEAMAQQAQVLSYPFPYLYDESQMVAKSYQAACTPDFYLFDESSQLVYRGQFDNSRPGNDAEVSGKDLSAAMNNLLNHAPMLENQKPSLGCNIKWR